MLALLAQLFLASPVPYCPPDKGQARWDGVRFEFKSNGTYAVAGTIWDRDQNGVPSKGDVFRIVSGWLDGKPLPFEKTLIVLGEALATPIATALASLDTPVSCETILALNSEPPTLATDAQLARHLDETVRPALVDEENARKLATDLGRWAQEICKKTKYINSAELAEALMVKAARPYGALGDTLVRAAADLASRDGSLTCTRLTTGTISFD